MRSKLIELTEGEVRSELIELREGIEFSFETAYADMTRDGIVRMQRIVIHVPLTASFGVIVMMLCLSCYV